VNGVCDALLRPVGTPCEDDAPPQEHVEIISLTALSRDEANGAYTNTTSLTPGRADKPQICGGQNVNIEVRPLAPTAFAPLRQQLSRPRNSLKSFASRNFGRTIQWC
jgi:hypothetical protein